MIICGEVTAVRSHGNSNISIAFCLILGCETPETERHKMVDQRFRALSSCLVIASLVVIVTAQNNVAEKG